MILSRSAAALLLPCALLLAGCKPKPGATTSESANDTQARVAVASVDPATLGSVQGTVNWKGTPPARVKIDMSQDPACTLSNATNLTEQYVVDHNHLANVFIYVKSTPTTITPAAETQSATIDQKGCRFTPHVVAIYKGGSVTFTNSDPTMHNVHTMSTQVGNHAIDVSEGPGSKPESLSFKDAETMVPVRCNNHPWMNAFVNVSPTPFFSVSAADGTFHIMGLPAGSYTLAFVHEKLGEQDVSITITAQQTTTATATFQSK